MSVLLRFLGIEPDPTPGGGEDASLARIAARLEGLPADRARFFACFAYVLARVAHADLRFEDEEVGAMQDVLRQFAGIGGDEARIVVDIARAEVDRLGGTQNYLVTRAFGELATQEEKLQLLECLYAVAAADDVITGAESSEIVGVAEEIGLTRQDALAVRARFRDKLAELRPLRGERS
jgi:uncharacterized tellurite resistance protein B-like protein